MRPKIFVAIENETGKLFDGRGFNASDLCEAKNFTESQMPEAEKFFKECWVTEVTMIQPPCDFKLKFDDCPYLFDICMIDDDWIDGCRLMAEAKMERKLEVDPKTDYPNFTVWDEEGYDVAAG